MKFSTQSNLCFVSHKCYLSYSYQKIKTMNRVQACMFGKYWHCRTA